MHCAGLDLCSLCGDGPEEADGNRTFAIEEPPSLQLAHFASLQPNILSLGVAIQGFDFAG